MKRYHKAVYPRQYGLVYAVYTYLHIHVSANRQSAKPLSCFFSVERLPDIADSSSIHIGKQSPTTPAGRWGGPPEAKNFRPFSLHPVEIFEPLDTVRALEGYMWQTFTYGVDCRTLIINKATYVSQRASRAGSTTCNIDFTGVCLWSSLFFHCLGATMCVHVRAHAWLTVIMTVEEQAILQL